MSNDLPKRSRRRRRVPLDRAAASARALAKIGFDPAKDIDELAILRSLASDPSLAPGPRIQACKALREARGGVLPSAADRNAADLTARALKLLNGGRS